MFRSSGGQEGDGYWQRQIKGIYTPHVVGSNCLVVAHLLTLLSRLLRIQSASTTILLLSFRSSRYFLFLFPILVFPIPPSLSTNMLFACLFPSISYCVPRHTVVEFCECSPTFWKFWQLGTDCPFIFPGGRTAWTARVLVNWKLYQARFFYDGDRNAREDAAEVALYHLAPKTHAAVSQSYLTGRLFPYEYDLHEGQWPMTQELKRYEKHYY